jgi:hypothetical protein
MKIHLPQRYLYFQTIFFSLVLGSAAPTDVFCQTFDSSNLPIVIINTQGSVIVDEPKVGATMGIIDKGNNQINRLSDTPNNYNGKIGIEYRGASSQAIFPEKSYSIETRAADDNNQEVSLLGMPQESDWILYAPYGDKSLMRNVLTYYIGRQMGRYATRTRYCELVVNGKYEGVYVLMEKIKRSKDRVDISKMSPEEITGDNLTGGYLLKIDKSEGNQGSGWTSPIQSSSNHGIYFQYEYPKSSVIVSQQKEYIKDFVKNFETTLNGQNFADPVNGYAKYIDVPSFIDYMIVTELTKNIDGYRLSFYMHKDKNSKSGKLVAGPIWDYNLGYGNANYCLGESYSNFAYDFNTICPDDGFAVPFWWEKLRTDPAFNQQLSIRWHVLRQSILKTENLMSRIDLYKAQLNIPQARNFQRWPILGEYVWPNSFIGETYDEEVNFLKTWLTNRLNWLDKNMVNVVTSVEEPLADRLVFQASPNPFSTEVNLSYTPSQSGQVVVKIHSLLGKVVTTLADTGRASEKRKIQWNGRDTRGGDVPAGTYVCTLEKDGKVLSRCKLQKTH